MGQINEPDPEQVQLENHKAALQVWAAKSKLHGDAVLAQSLAQFNSVVLQGQAALRSAILINGGAAAAMLAFLGHLSTAAIVRHQPHQFASSLLAFACGVVIGAAATGTTYLSQYCHSVDKPGRGAFLNAVSIVLVSASYVAFSVGIAVAYRGFQ